MSALFSKSAISQAISAFRGMGLKNKIDATDREIDEMVFEGYGLSEEEKRVVLDS